MFWITNEGGDLLGLAYGPRSVVGPDPDHQFVPSSSGHLVEELQALLASLWVEDARFQQCTVPNWSGRRIELHVIASIWNKPMQFEIEVASECHEAKPTPVWRTVPSPSYLCSARQGCDLSQLKCSACGPSLRRRPHSGSCHRCWSARRSTGPVEWVCLLKKK